VTTLTRAEAARLIDHTLLDPRARPDDIRALVHEAEALGVKAVCVNSGMAGVARAERSPRSPVKLAVTVGFPLGAMDSAAKAAETRAAREAGADEFDMVMALGWFLAGEERHVVDDVAAVVAAADGLPVKVIVESGWLTEADAMRAARLARDGGAAMVKTSTGVNAPGATPEAVAWLRAAVGPALGVKAAGGIRTKAALLAMVEAGATRIGMSATRSVLDAWDQA
jgi:deoxyribose-phosphate aldolase